MIKKIGLRLAEAGVAATALTFLGAGTSWATVQVSGPDASLLAGGAVIGALIVAKWWRHK